MSNQEFNNKRRKTISGTLPLDIEKLEKLIKEKLYSEPKMNPYQNIPVSTGAGGVKLFQKSMLTFLDLSPEELEKREKKIDESYIEPGAYTITDVGIKYHGLRDGEMKDGIYGIKNKKNDKYYIELWKDGLRLAYSIVSEEENENIKINGLPKDFKFENTIG